MTMAYKLIWLADVLRAAGLNVVEVAGWETRGRAEMGTVKGVLLHHTAGGAKGDAPSLELVTKGRKDLAGPLSQLVLGRSGTFYVVAAGRCNHAGEGSWHGVTAGNSELIGIEAENMGTVKDPWPVAQMIAYEKGVAAILRHIGADAVMAAGHKEYATPRGRKIDPSFDVFQFRENVRGWMLDPESGDPAAMSPDPTPSVLSMLRLGDQGASVTKLQAALGMLQQDGAFGPVTDAMVRAFQARNGLDVDGKVGPATWKALGIG